MGGSWPHREKTTKRISGLSARKACADVGHGPGSKVHIQKSKVAVLFIRTDNCFTFTFDDITLVTCLLESIEQDLSKIVICSYKEQTFCHAS